MAAQDKQTQVDKHVQRIVDAAPPLTAEQRDRLALLLRTSPPAPPVQGRSS